MRLEEVRTSVSTCRLRLSTTQPGPLRAVFRGEQLSDSTPHPTPCLPRPGDITQTGLICFQVGGTVRRTQQTSQTRIYNTSMND